MSDYATNVSKYVANVDATAVKAIVDYCGIALRNRDSTLVSTSDSKEMARVRDGFAVRRLGLSPEAADAATRSTSSAEPVVPRRVVVAALRNGVSARPVKASDEDVTLPLARDTTTAAPTSG